MTERRDIDRENLDRARAIARENAEKIVQYNRQGGHRGERQTGRTHRGET